MEKAARLALAAAVLLPGSPAQATNGMRMIGFGPVQNSMGGVGVGATLDGSGLASNPAGMTELARRLDLGFTWFRPVVEYRATEPSPSPFPAGAFVARQGATIDSDRGGSPIPALAAVVPLGHDLTFGVGVFGVAGLGVDYTQNLYGGKTYTSYLQGRLAPALAWRAAEWISIGLAFNAMVAQMKYDVAAGFGQVVHDTATALGVGVTAGLQLRPVKGWTVGLAYESKSSFQDFSFDVPAHAVPNPSPPPAAFQVPGGKDKLDFDQPSVATIGLSYAPIESFLIAADVEWIRWSETNGKNKPKYTNDTQLTGAQPFDLSWEDQWVYKLGIQYAATQSLRVRAGWNYGKQPLDKNRAFENIAFPAIAEHHLTAGLGWDATPSLTVNLAGMYAPQAKLAGSNLSQGLASYETRMSQWSLDAGVAWRF
jgi:long-chain fatty acid transport protein